MREEPRKERNRSGSSRFLMWTMVGALIWLLMFSIFFLIVFYILNIVGESAIYFCIAVLTCIGIGIWVFYGAYGLAMLPVYLIKGSKSLQETKTEV